MMDYFIIDGLCVYICTKDPQGPLQQITDGYNATPSQCYFFAPVNLI